jgi:hypothetical protein
MRSVKCPGNSSTAENFYLVKLSARIINPVSGTVFLYCVTDLSVIACKNFILKYILISH